jgi:hypothetical protein
VANKTGGVVFYNLMLMQEIYRDKDDTLLGILMDRDEAVSYLKEILTQCGELIPEALSLETPKDDPAGLRVHIRGRIHEIEKQKVREIAQKRNLTVKEEADGLIVFRVTNEIHVSQ